MLKDLINEHLVKSMKEKNQLKVSTLRMINSSIKDFSSSSELYTFLVMSSDSPRSA